MIDLDLLQHPKTLRLAQSLNIPPWAAVGLLKSVWDWAAEYKPAGEMSFKDLCLCAITIEFDGDLARVLMETGWLDSLSESKFYLHDWNEHFEPK